MVIDGVLLVGFGGVTAECCGRLPACPGRVRCFVSKVLGDDPRQAARIDEVAAHYAHFGDVSPYNERTNEQALALETALGVPVRCGFRNWPPTYDDGLQTLAAAGCRRIGLVVLAPHQTSRSWDQYIAEAEAAAREATAPVPAIIGVAEPWWDHPGFIDACADELRRAAGDWQSDDALLLTAHAIPQPAEARSPYRQQVAASARLVAEAAGHSAHRVAFQSAPDASRIPWSEPRLEAAIAELAVGGCRRLVVQAVGFLVDHIEVLYDLDVEAAAQCAELGLDYRRAACVHDHPAFIACLAERCRAIAT